MFEMELEELDTLVKLMKESSDKFILVGQLNYIAEKTVAVEVLVTTKADYNGSPVIVSYKEEIGRELLPKDESDTEGTAKMKQLEEKIADKREEIKSKLTAEGFMVEYGLWKTYES